MDALAPFRIPVATLKADQAMLEWSLGPEFLVLFNDQPDVEKGNFTVTMNLHRSAGITTLYFLINGIVDTPCDRCSAPIQMPVSGEYDIIVKFGDPKETTDEVIFVHPEVSELNIGSHIYDFILLSIPIRRRIEDCDSLPDPPCDMVVLSYLSKNEENNNPDDGDEDSPWDDLKKVIDN
ncbi:MAG: DUF177 domain-containing protein [Saprospiraceae bacterium]|uniref:DUF177 domain-containing protein n=1 Tax=Candidatus Opimibacter skivensis TaxID=2982028 RepID=A0A9D7XPJ9_9BACT|nr:DUF177 domain-containing protein [Candidatus Opimibacter skivensis]